MIQKRERINTISVNSANKYRQKKSYEINRNKEERYRTEPVQNRRIVQYRQTNVGEEEITREKNGVIF